MQEGRALLAADLAGARVGVVVAVSREHDLRAVALGRLCFGDRRGLGHDDGRGDAELLCGAGHALGVVAGGGGDDGTALAPLDHGGDLVGRAADLERAGLLPVLAFEIDLAARHGGEGRGEIKLGMMQNGTKPLLSNFKILQFDIHRGTSKYGFIRKDCTPAAG